MKNIVLVILIASAGYYFYQKNEQSHPSVTALKDLLDKVDSTPVTSDEAKSVFKTMVILTCETNGEDIKNGFGTTEECLAKLENRTHKMCTDRVFGSSGKNYNSKILLKADFSTYFKCAASDLETITI